MHCVSCLPKASLFGRQHLSIFILAWPQTDKNPRLSLRPQPPYLTPKPQTPSRFVPARFHAVRPAPHGPASPLLCASLGDRTTPTRSPAGSGATVNFSASDQRPDKDIETLLAGTAPSLPPVRTQQTRLDLNLPSSSPSSLPPYSSSFQPTPHI